MAKNKPPLVRRFKRVIICHQQTKFGEPIEVWPSQKVGVKGQSIVIFAKIENVRDSFLFFLRLSKSFLDETLLS